MKFTTKLRSILGGESRESRERNYLEQSVSLIDLERRQREIDRGLFSAMGRFPF
ncbi:DUF3563 family protein [Jiella sp. MQZ9-1]|uniref:DUF3563 family protein n=1 Tax=Jiella flava TaxID=2816857 RepID=A0A939JRX9_9HYPH|nr:DUF3563 family protein [Jiella flava]MBO0662388.1 DUF3563 family protein [Jiella flava]MCD2471612.1 DUF3563 family protein [Jiella flava]